MASFNRVILVGNLTRDIELRYTPAGTAVTDMGMAVNERVKRNEQWTDEVNYFDVTLWGRTAEVASEYLSKGSSVLIEGRLKYETWEQDGQKRSKVKIVGERMQMLGSRTGGGGSVNKPHTQSGQMDQTAVAGMDQTAVAGMDQTAAAGNVTANNTPPEDEVPF